MLEKKLMLAVVVILLAFASIPAAVLAQDDGGLPPTYDEFVGAVQNSIEDGTVDELWQEVVASGEMPIIYTNRVIFMHEAEADSVAWASEFLGMSFATFTPYQLEGTRLGESNIWMAEVVLPYDGRFNYSLVVDGEVIMRDPLAQYQQLEGAGYISSIYMPGYVYPEATIPRDDIGTGVLSEDIMLSSENLERDVNVRIYTPVGYDQLSDLPVVYTSDGNDYWHDEMGSLVTILDNLIADGRINPVIVAFVDARDVVTGENLRMNELAARDPFAMFVTEELIPYVDENYKTDSSREARVILGTSLGGAMALHIGLNYSDWFGNLAVQSPFMMFFSPEVVPGYQALEEPLPLKVFMNQGTYDLDMVNTRLLRDVFVEDDYELRYVETNNQHGWSNWPALLDEMLIYFFGTEGAEGSVPPFTTIGD